MSRRSGMAWTWPASSAWARPPLARRSCTPATSASGCSRERPWPGSRSAAGFGCEVSSRALLLVERNFTVYRRGWLIIASGFFEPVFYLLSIGVVLVALMRGVLYAAGFLVVMLAMGLVHSWWAVLALPAATLIAFAFAAVGLAATTFMRHSEDARLVQLALLPLFLFSTTFYPLSEYASELQILVQATPLYHGIELLRALTTGTVGAGLLGHVAYLVAMSAIALALATRRLDRRLRI